MGGKNIIAIIFSLLLDPIWGLGLLSIDFSNSYSVFTIIILSTVLQHELLKKNESKNQSLVLVGPLIYLLLAIVTLYINPQEDFFKHPILWAFAAYFFGFMMRNNSRKILYPITTAFSLIYTLLIYPSSQYYNEYSFNEVVEIELKVNSHNINNFSFIHQAGELAQLEYEGYLLLETWNESCPPCIKSIKAIQDTLGKIEGLSNYYLYQEKGGKSLEQEAILNFEMFKKKDKIIIDPQNTLFDSLNLQLYPYFLIFNEDGDLIDSRNGYSSQIKDELLEWINKTTSKGQDSN